MKFKTHSESTHLGVKTRLVTKEKELRDGLKNCFQTD